MFELLYVNKARRINTTWLLLLLAFALFGSNGFGQDHSNSEDSSAGILLPTIDSLLRTGHQNEMFPGASLAFLIADSLYYFNSGYSAMDSQVAASESTRYQLGSIGKLLTALAVLQEVEKGHLDLHADISAYIEDTGLEFSSETPLTLHCLLTHSCGFNDVNIGYLAADMESVLPLEQFIEQFNPGIFQAPGTDISYSNYSYALAGLIVEKISGAEFSAYVNKNIFTPLGMINSTLEFPEAYENSDVYAHAYKKVADGFEEVRLYPRHALPAGSLVSTAEDMGLFIQALFNREPGLLNADSWELFYTEQFSNHSLLNGYSYGLEHQNSNGLDAWAKGGMLPGMLAHILIVPDKYALFLVVNTDEDLFGEDFYPALFDQSRENILPHVEIRKNIRTTKYTGVYRDKRYNRNTEENIISLFRGQFSVYENRTKDTLVVYHNGRWHNYVPTDEGIFQNTEFPNEYMVFREGKKGTPDILFRNVNIGGLYIPASFERTKWYNSPSFINDVYGIIPLFAMTGILFIVASLFVRFIGIWKRDFFKNMILPAGFLLLFSTAILLHVLHSYFVPLQLIRNSQDFLLGYPSSFKIFSFLGYLMIPLALGLGLYTRKLWKDRLGSLFSRIYLSLVEISIVIHLVFLFYWDFL